MNSAYIDYSGYWICPICSCENYFDVNLMEPGESVELNCDTCGNTISVELWYLLDHRV
jgi:transcription elongation factor Elf1